MLAKSTRGVFVVLCNGLCAATLLAQVSTDPGGTQTGTTPTTQIPSTIDQSQLQDLLDQAGLGNLTGGQTNNPDLSSLFQDDNSNGGGGGGTGGGSGGSAPLIGSDPNQFNAHRGPGLQARRPGLQLQRAIGIEQGNADVFTATEQVNDDSFFRRAFETIVLQTLDAISQNLTSFLGSAGLGNLSNLGNLFNNNNNQTPNQQPTITPIDNATTTGQGETTPIQ